VGMSDKGNGYVFLIQKSNTFVAIDSKDAKYNETFADCRGRQSKLTMAHYIDPDLKEEQEKEASADEFESRSSNRTDDEKDEPQRDDRQRRKVIPRTFLLPGTGTYSKEIDVRKQQYSNLCLDNLMEDNTNTILIMDCMEAQKDDETMLMKELELLTACALNEKHNEVLAPAITNDKQAAG
jgi:hypothetical protein